MPNIRRNRVTLLEIAQASGVSLTAVSLALSDKPGISQETRLRVMETARSLGYRFRSPMTSQPVRKINTIGLLVSSLTETELYVSHFYSHIIAEIEANCRQMGIDLMFAHLPIHDDGTPIQLPPLLDKSTVDGYIIAGICVDGKLSRVLEHRNTPVVLFEAYSQVGTYNSVLYDNFHGAYKATEYLIQKGHRAIGFIGGTEHDFPSFRDRRHGYQKAVDDYHIEQSSYADFLLYPAQHNEIGITVERFLSQNRQITGLVCVTDDTAIASINRLREVGIEVPRDISVIGFDDIFMAESSAPPLTTMRVNKQSMSWMAIQILLNQIAQENADSVTAVFHPTLVERNSVNSLINPFSEKRSS